MMMMMMMMCFIRRINSLWTVSSCTESTVWRGCV